jgi:hypothetical protein
MTSSDLFEDDFINSLDYFQRYLWIGLFVACADDQGRFMDSHPIIRAKVFPLDREVTDEIVEAALINYCAAGKIVRYVANGKHLAQIVKWWTYQAPSWASPSKYPAPEGWTDRFKYHTVGNKIHVENWNEKGGYTLDSKLPSRLHSQQGSAIDESESESEVKSEVKSEGEEEARKEKIIAAATATSTKALSLDTFSRKVFTQITGMLEFPAKDKTDAINAVESLRSKYDTAEKMVDYLTPFWNEWYGRNYRKTNLAWLTEWAVSGEIPFEKQKKKSLHDILQEAI